MRLSALAIAALCTVIVSIGVGFLPLFGGPGYEQALAVGLFAPTIAAVCAALRAHPRQSTPLAAVLDGGCVGAMCAGLALVVAWLHLLHVPACDPFAGSVHYALTSGAGLVLAGLWGGVLGALAGPARSRKTLVLGAAALPISCIVLSVVRFWTSPMIFAFDPFVGYFSGSLYDTVIEPGAALVTYRAGTAVTACAILAMASALRFTGAGVRLCARSAETYTKAGIGVVAALASLLHCAYGTHWDHFHTKTSIRAALGGYVEGTRCNIVYPTHLRESEVKLLLRDCEEQLGAVERSLGATGPAHVTAYYFRDAAEKRRLMGAANTYIAKPWRQEVYLQLAAYPHPVLAHELAHVVAGTFGRGPFRIAGRFGGLLPNPGLIEGIAVAAAPEDDDLTELQWARAMRDLNLLPSVPSLFSLGFLTQSSSRSYTVAGAFVLYIKRTYTMAVVRAWYAGADVEQVTGKSWSTLEAGFVASLDDVAFPPAALALARARFSRPSVFGRRCPHVFDALREQADGCRDRGEFTEADNHYLALREAEPTDASAALAAAISQLRQRKLDAARRLIEPLATPAAQGPLGFRARELLADAAVLANDFPTAESRYAQLSATAFDEDTARAYDVKLLALRMHMAAGRATTELPPAFALLLSAGMGRGPDPVLGLLDLASASARAVDPVADYLLARHLVQRGEHRRALPFLLNAQARATDVKNGLGAAPRLQRELVRMLAVCGCALEESALQANARDQLSAAGPFAYTSGGRRAAVEALLNRCAASKVGLSDPPLD